ncbi:hypothetical protein [Corynebacterium minutissimum]|uniref:hypothetical protein n=1 Tax=Corynebacterium minutissimum TaxID=38301 RepID=UPI0015F0D5EF|nr:hypothetical protein [Corynebacterium minutissimum]QRP60590.1 hypothetical protein I6J26_10590 [Corynebacterium minutissimum]
MTRHNGPPTQRVVKATRLNDVDTATNIYPRPVLYYRPRRGEYLKTIYVRSEIAII